MFDDDYPDTVLPLFDSDSIENKLNKIVFSRPYDHKIEMSVSKNGNE